MGKSTVTIGELRDHLSAYLRRVRRGEELVVRDRQTPIARLAPYVTESLGSLGSPGADPSAELEMLVASGVLRPPETVGGWDAFFHSPAPRLRGNPLLGALLADREEEKG